MSANSADGAIGVLIKLKLQFCLLCKEPVIIYHLGGEGGGKIFEGSLNF